ncbi:hypothetical protein KFE80_01920 [bacterium SCSIO 12696]|nr:hypothetical protein KFE80_01920 [bacterium SCSIO 12696]
MFNIFFKRKSNSRLISWQNLLPKIKPYSKGWEIYLVKGDSYILASEAGKEFNAEKVALNYPGNIEPWEKKAPCKHLLDQIMKVSGFTAHIAINRKGPFYGYYISIE